MLLKESCPSAWGHMLQRHLALVYKQSLCPRYGSFAAHSPWACMCGRSVQGICPHIWYGAERLTGCFVHGEHELRVELRADHFSILERH
eukprot:4907425-Amphidinium_carterae.1